MRGLYKALACGQVITQACDDTDGDIYTNCTSARRIAFLRRSDLRSSRSRNNWFLVWSVSPNRAQDQAEEEPKLLDALIHPTMHCVSEYGNVTECIRGDGILSAGPVHSSTCCE